MAQVPFPFSPTPPMLQPRPVSDINRALDNAVNLPAEVLARISGNPIDPWGRTMADDYARYYFARPAMKELEAIRNELDARGLSGENLVPNDLHERVEQLIRVEACKSFRIVTYWGDRRSLDYHRDLVVALLDRAGQPERNWAMPQLNALDKAAMEVRDNLEKEIASCVTADPYAIPNSIRGRGVWAGLQELRKELAVRVDVADEAAGRLRPMKSRTSPCPKLPSVPGEPQPRLRHVPDLDRHYPAEAIDESLMGTVQVRVGYDENGCVVEAAVYRSSGSDLLDGVAMAVAFETVFIPGLVDGAPSAGHVVIPINFNIPSGR